MDGKFSAEHLADHLPRFFALGDRVKDRIYVSRRNDCIIVHACTPSLIYDRVTSMPPKDVSHLFRAVMENDEGRLACDKCKTVIDKKLEMAIRLRRFNV